MKKFTDFVPFIRDGVTDKQDPVQDTSYMAPVEPIELSHPGPCDLKVRTKSFALRIVNVYRKLPRTEEARVIAKQMLRSGTSIGANYRVACRSRSKAEFISKIGIVLEEADETIFWLELLLEAKVFRREKVDKLLNEANELTSIFVASLRTSKGIDRGLTSAF
jgi:four helix bundle protein